MTLPLSTTRSARAFGHRARLGIVVPPTNTVNEAEWARMVPEGVTFHSHRMPLHGGLDTPEGLAALHADLDQAIAMLTPAGVDVVAYACTAGSTVTPAQSLPEALTVRNGVPVITTAAAVVDALRAVEARKISVATPYHEALNQHEAHFLHDHGFEVLGIRGLGIGAGGPSEFPRIARTTLAEVRAHVLQTVTPGSEAVLLACTDFPTLPLIPELEQDLGIPVISSNTATLRAALLAAGLPARAAAPAGRLLS